MNRLALEHDRKGLGEREADLLPRAYNRLSEIKVPVLIVTGALDIPFMEGAAEYMRDAIPQAVSIEFPNAAHLPNMEHPARFNEIVEAFLVGR